MSYQQQLVIHTKGHGDMHDLTEQVAAAALLGALQGLDGRLRRKEMAPGMLHPSIEKQWKAIRRDVAYLTEDRPLEGDLRHMLGEIRKRAWPLYGKEGGK